MKTRSFLRLPILFVSCLLVLGWAVSASAACSNSACSITSGAGQGAGVRIGTGLPVPAPVTNPNPNPAPYKFLATQMAQANAYAWVYQGATPTPSIMIAPSQFKHSVNTVNVPIITANPNIFQIVTNFVLTFPGGSTAPFAGTFKVGGRTGPQNVDWCPGDPVPTPGGAGGTCTANGGPGGTRPNPGIIHYIGTTKQFGGPMPFNITQGVAQIALVNSITPGCLVAGNCIAGFASGVGVSPGAIGNAWGVTGQSSPIPNTTTIKVGAYTTGGRITLTTGVGAGMNATNMAQSWGAPWTTGQIMVTQSAAAGAAETFTLTGSDARTAGGGGTISLVSAAVSARAYTGPNANRGWLTFVVPEPTMALGAGGALLMLVACHFLVRRRSR